MPKPYEIFEVYGDRDEETGQWSKEWAITFDGIQWAPPGYPRDRDGSGDFTCSTEQEAREWAEKANTDEL